MNAAAELMAGSVVMSAIAGMSSGRTRLLFGMMSLLAFAQAVQLYKMVGIEVIIVDGEKSWNRN